MHRKDRRSRRRFIVGSAATFAGIARVEAPAQPAQFEFKVASTVPANHPSMVRGRQMWDAVERESAGRVHAQIFPAGELGSDQALLSQLRLGALHFFVNLSDFPPIIPVVDIANVGFAFRDEAEALHVMDGPLGEYLRKEFVAKGLFALSRFWDSGMRVITTGTRPIRVADDLKELKIRVAQSKISVDFYKTLGASPLPLSASEVYSALQTKLADGEDAPLVTIEGAHWYENQRYLSVTNHSWSGLAVVCNGDVWKSIPSDIQAVIERNNSKYSLLQRRDTELVNAATAEKIGRRGLLVNKVDPTTFRLRLHSYYERWAAIFGAAPWGMLQSSIAGSLG